MFFFSLSPLLFPQVRLNQVSYLVLDEADRMLDMGFEPQVRFCLQSPVKRIAWKPSQHSFGGDVLLLAPISMRTSPCYVELTCGISSTVAVSTAAQMRNNCSSPPTFSLTAHAM